LSPALTAQPAAGSFAIVGAGVFGAWTAYLLRRAGHAVTLIDQYGPASSRASSGGESRIIRASYGPDEIYSRMAVRSLGMSKDFAERLSRPLFHKTGVLWMAMPDSTYANESRAVLHKLGVPFDDLPPDEVRRRYPQIRPVAGAGAIFEPESGALMARQCVQAVVEAFAREGGKYILAQVRTPAGSGKLSRLELGEGKLVEADAFVFACGPWLPKVFARVLGHRIFPTKQDVVFFGIPPGDRRFEPPQMPIWIDFGDQRGMYGFPDLENRGFKVAFDLHGPAFDPDYGVRTVEPAKIREARAYVAERFPALGNSPMTETRVCQYENTSNGDFLLDRHPDFENVWLAGGGSGHGFKHGPAVGEYLAARLTGTSSPPVEPRFSFASKGTEQNRAVY
jgi:glycine/D-amino acid oxidase-like deaminating enzyme